MPLRVLMIIDVARGDEALTPALDAADDLLRRQLMMRCWRRAAAMP